MPPDFAQILEFPRKTLDRLFEDSLACTLDLSWKSPDFVQILGFPCQTLGMVFEDALACTFDVN